MLLLLRRTRGRLSKNDRGREGKVKAGLCIDGSGDGISHRKGNTPTKRLEWVSLWSADMDWDSSAGDEIAAERLIFSTSK